MSDDDLKKLIEQAFIQARDAGKRDWNRMTIAVLKNRLLQLTARSFDESAFGGGSLLDLVHRFPETIAVDATTKPPTIEWLEAGAAPVAHVGRVRPDLWRAMLDYSSGRQYEWDVAHAQAIPVQAADPSRKIPTVDADVLAEWRGVFLQEHVGSIGDDDDRARFEEWAAKSLGTQYLPRRFREMWNDRLRDAVVERLQSWFDAKKIAVPRLTVETPPAPAHIATRDVSLRAFLHECIDTMNERELEGLVLPARVAHRVRSR